jgi:hypothetical protein
VKIEIQDGEISAYAESSDSFSSFGGEYWDDDYKFADYGLDLGDISISNISPEQYKGLALEMINHLLINGYRFELRDNKDGNGEYLAEIK